MSSLTLTAKAIRRSILAATAASVAFSGVAFAEEAEKVERIEVTGSRIKQVDMETVSPVTVIDAAAIAMTGEKTVADVLNNSAINSFGSWRGTSGFGSGASSTSSVNLRGLGSSATLVLLDGRRLPGTSSSSGAEADTSSIPMSIVERIEILRDGASAVYGSDAVAGVINIITKKEFDGVSIDLSHEMPEVEGGDATRYSIATGYNTDKGNITLTYEHYEADSVMDRDIWRMDDPTYNAYSSFSSVPNGASDSGWVDNSALCGEVENTVGIADGRCLYSFGAVTKLFGDVSRDSVLSNFSYDITDDIQFRGRASASLAETNTRYAGTPVSTNFPVMSADNPYNPYAANGGEDITVYMRSVQIGERDTLTETNNFDILAGLVGFADVGNGIDWEFNVQNSHSTTNSFNYNLVNDSIVQREIDSGEYDIFNTTGMSYNDWNSQMTQLYSAAAHTGVYQGKFESTQVDGLVSTLLLDGDNVTVAMVVGAEYEMIDFKQMSDPESAAGIISGGSGGDDVDATRDRTAGYLEFQVGLPADFEISAAVRYERYEQEGQLSGPEGVVVNSSTFDAVVPKLGVSWRPVDSLLLRASYGDSFRAPNMGEMFSSQALSFEDALDNKWCNTPGNNDETYCDPNQQHKTWFGGYSGLEAEEGNSFTVGGVWNVTDAWNIELSYYSITYDNKIEAVSVDDLLRDELRDGSSESIIRDPSTGKILYMESGYRNMATVETSGIDFVTAYNFETSVGDFRIKADLSHILDFKEQTNEEAELVDYAGLQDTPDLRGNLAFSWNYDDYSAAWSTVYIGSQSAQYYRDLYDYDAYADYSSYFKHNVQFAYNHSMNGSVTVGVNNLLDEEAPTFYNYADYRDVNTNLYDVLGRTYYVRINQKF
ncbi:TonB-dependent receptor [Shewanella olleyana]|uniref:TonB-dependent receptor n=1 Tax=Shewanella olleyana TaxID=135626 RepID=UPI00200E42B7|nr:TonB-dependent receptor [Shewanella olleyana]MCL1066329.1 TonB-dependent receptor [Shewanella olleyana]